MFGFVCAILTAVFVTLLRSSTPPDPDKVCDAACAPQAGLYIPEDGFCLCNTARDVWTRAPETP